MTDTPQTITEAPVAEHTRLDIHDILRILPHRYPFLLIDRVVDLVRKQRIVAIKNVTINEPFFAGHFPNLPIMPGVLIVEAMAQAGGALLLTEIRRESLARGRRPYAGQCVCRRQAGRRSHRHLPPHRSRGSPSPGRGFGRRVSPIAPRFP
jgi:hypothetical protein